MESNIVSVLEMRWFIVPNSGHYGDRTVVFSSHKNYDTAARRLASLPWGYTLRQGQKKKGEVFLRAYESIYPIPEQLGLGMDGKWHLLGDDK